jgi:hypothetical protein
MPVFTTFYILRIIGFLGSIILAHYIFIQYSTNPFGYYLTLTLSSVLGFYISQEIGLRIDTALLKRRIKKIDSTTLKQLLDKQHNISQFIIDELLQRGAAKEDFRDYVLWLLQSDSVEERDSGWRNLNLWFPEMAGYVETFDAKNPSFESRTKLVELQTQNRVRSLNESKINE